MRPDAVYAGSLSLQLHMTPVIQRAAQEEEGKEVRGEAGCVEDEVYQAEGRLSKDEAGHWGRTWHLELLHPR